jgi:hypothetical protein
MIVTMSYGYDGSKKKSVNLAKKKTKCLMIIILGNGLDLGASAVQERASAARVGLASERTSSGPTPLRTAPDIAHTINRFPRASHVQHPIYF